MNHIISVSVHKIPNSENLRAFLWNGRVAKSDSMVMVAESSHGNIFVSLRQLSETIKEWWERNKKPNVLGLNPHIFDLDQNPEPCWLLNPELASVSKVSELETETRRHIVHCGGYKGLCCLIFGERGSVYEDRCYRAVLYEVLPMPPLEQTVGALRNCSFFGPNLFVAAEELERMLRSSSRITTSPKVAGIDDESPCWPEGLGAIQFK